MASKIFLNQSFKNIYHLLICFINEIINDAAPATKDLRFLHNSKVLIGCLRKVNYIYFGYIPKIINYALAIFLKKKNVGFRKLSPCSAGRYSI